MNKNKLVESMAAMRETATDEVAVKAKELYNEWQYEETVVGDDGVEVKIPIVYAVGNRRRYGDNLYKCIQAHTAQADWTPDVTASLWEVIDETHEGTIDDPIPWSLNMQCYEGKYYTYEGVLYICIRDSGIALGYAPNEVLGQYFELV